MASYIEPTKKIMGRMAIRHVIFVKGSSRYFNPSLDERIIQRAMERDPLSARCEWLGEFRDDVEAFINRELIESLVVQDRLRLPYDRNVAYQAFVDPSGGGQDGFCLCIAHMERGERVVIDLLDEIQGGNPEIAVARHAETILSYGMSNALATNMRAMSMKTSSQIRRDYRFAEHSKTELYGNALPLMNAAELNFWTIKN